MSEIPGRRDRSRRLELAAVAVGALVLLLALVLVLSQDAPRLAYSNTRVKFSGVARAILPGRMRCQREAVVPPDAAAVRVFARVHGRRRGALELIARKRARVVGRGVAPPAAATEQVTIPFRAPSRVVTHVEVCLRNRGATRIDLAGNVTPGNPEAADDLRHAPDDIRLDYLRPGRESWWQIAGLVAARFPLAKAGWIGAWTMWVALALFALGAASGVLVVLRARDE